MDDEPALRRILHTALFSRGFDISEASNGDEALALCRILHSDAVLLDLAMPGRSGIETCAELRRLMPRLAILMLSVSDDEERKVAALEAGADDYITKPFHLRELVARIRAALRRGRAFTDPAADFIAIGDIRLSAARRLVFKAGAPIHLTPKEFDLLHHLMANAGLPVAHARLLQVVWGAEYIEQVEYLRTFMRQLRRKLEQDAAHPQYLLTESYIGYRFVDSATAPQASL